MPSFRKYQVHTLSADFRKATKIVEVPEIPKASAGQVIVKNHYVGIMATDTVLPNGFYGHTSPPFDCGIEAVGVVTEVGAGVENFKVGSAIVYSKLPGAFAEYVEVDAATAVPIPSPDPAALPLFNCGVSASIALEQAGQMKQGGQTVLVTAAAGTTGQYVVQLAKLAGNTVIGTTSSDEKAAVLKKLGADRVINYTNEDVSAVLKAEYPNGVDLVFDSVGGSMFDAAVDNIAVNGRIIVYGLLSTYKDTTVNPTRMGDVANKLLFKSAAVQGFAVMFHLHHAPAHIGRLMALTQEGKLVSEIDPTPFSGLEAIPEAIDYMYAKKNVGKLVVKLV